ncbi:hypothetical protein HZA38_01550 [Candidatus Peregrinibacteria bacterium]|nr:hypothetical protein [Candidatus Peregrinibacteria bacterium]
MIPKINVYFHFSFIILLTLLLFSLGGCGSKEVPNGKNNKATPVTKDGTVTSNAKASLIREGNGDEIPPRLGGRGEQGGGGNVISKTDGVCGSAAKVYKKSENNLTNELCKSGTPLPQRVNMPGIGTVATWACQGANGGKTMDCNAWKASSENTNEPLCTLNVYRQGNEEKVDWNTANMAIPSNPISMNVDITTGSAKGWGAGGGGSPGFASSIGKGVKLANLFDSQTATFMKGEGKNIEIRIYSPNNSGSKAICTATLERSTGNALPNPTCEVKIYKQGNDEYVSWTAQGVDVSPVNDLYLMMATTDGKTSLFNTRTTEGHESSYTGKLQDIIRDNTSCIAKPGNVNLDFEACKNAFSKKKQITLFRSDQRLRSCEATF